MIYIAKQNLKLYTLQFASIELLILVYVINSPFINAVSKNAI